jgi:hypothetical protein
LKISEGCYKTKISEGALPVDENFRGVKKIPEISEGVEKFPIISEGVLPVDENFRGVKKIPENF